MDGHRSLMFVPLVCVVALSACGGTHHAKAANASTTTSEQPSGGASYASYCGGAPDCPKGHVPALLRRSLHLPSITAGASCPTSAPGRQVTHFLGKAVGKGPVYAISERPLARRGILSFEYPPSHNSSFAGSQWGGQKVLWASSRSYHGPILIRGRQLDGNHAVGFGQLLIPYAELQFPAGHGDPSQGGWRAWPSETRLRAPGCYAWQVDGTDFSEVIVFRAVVSKPSP